MMKILKRIIFIVVLISMSIALLFVGNGYDMYKKSIEETSVEDKIAENNKKKITFLNDNTNVVSEQQRMKTLLEQNNLEKKRKNVCLKKPMNISDGIT